MKGSWHFAVSQRIALELGYSRYAALALAVGDVGVDLRHWRRDCAHGMTSMDPHTGLPTVAPRQAQIDWRTWIDTNLRKGRHELESRSDCSVGLYFVGMALHAVQDCEAHGGMTNAEHAKRYLNRTDPDLDPHALARGERATRSLLAGIFGADSVRLHRCAGRRSSAYQGIFRPPDGARVDIDPVGFLWQGMKWLHGDPPIVRWPAVGGE